MAAQPPTRLPATDPQTLRAFVAVAREGNVSRAAQRLHLSQPAVSLPLKTLADATGLRLFTRTPQGMALTRDGAALLPLADKALAALADFGQAAAALHQTVRGTLRIGTILDPEFTRLGAFLKQLVETAPQVGTELGQGMSGSVLERIARRELDVGFFLDLPQDPLGLPYRLRALTRFTYRVLAPAGWGPQVKGKDWKALAALPWLATPAGQRPPPAATARVRPRLDHRSRTTPRGAGRSGSVDARSGQERGRAVTGPRRDCDARGAGARSGGGRHGRAGM